MSKIVCVWADLGDDTKASQWYENTHIPDVVGRLDIHARHAERAKDNIFQEVAGIEGKLMTVYNVPDGKKALEVDMQIRLALDELPENTRLDTQCYTEHANWFGEDWRGDVNDTQMWIVALWQPADAIHDQYVKWFTEELAPGLLQSAGLLRLRIFKLENASLVKDHIVEQQSPSSQYQYLTLWESDCDELPWELLVYLGSSEKWRYYVEGGHIKWQIGQYLVNRVYPEDDNANSPTDR